MLSTLALICKIVGIILTGALGILGSISDLRIPDTKKLTRAGRATVIGIVIGIAVGALGEGLNAISSEDSSRSLAEANGVILRNVENVLTPIVGMSISQVIDVPDSTKPSNIYIERLKGLAKGLTPDSDLPTGVTRVEFANGGNGFFIDKGSEWFPHEDAEAALGVVGTLDLVLTFNKKALRVESLQKDGPMPADYRVRMSAFGFARSMDVRLAYEPARTGFRVEGKLTRVDANSAHISNPGRIFGEGDLRGGQFIACISSALPVGHEKEAVSVLKSMRPSEVSLRLASGRSIVLKPSAADERFSRGDQNCFIANPS